LHLPKRASPQPRVPHIWRALFAPDVGSKPGSHQSIMASIDLNKPGEAHP
jgi:hypothetical protein